MRRTPERLQDILDAIDAIHRFLGHRDREKN